MFTSGLKISGWSPFLSKRDHQRSYFQQKNQFQFLLYRRSSNCDYSQRAFPNSYVLCRVKQRKESLNRDVDLFLDQEKNSGLTQWLQSLLHNQRDIGIKRPVCKCEKLLVTGNKQPETNRHPIRKAKGSEWRKDGLAERAAWDGGGHNLSRRVADLLVLVLALLTGATASTSAGSIGGDKTWFWVKNAHKKWAFLSWYIQTLLCL